MNLAFNLGADGLADKWPNTVALIRMGDYAAVAKAMRNNCVWAAQVKGRAERLAKMMETRAAAAVWRLLGLRGTAGALAFLAAVLLFRESSKDGRQAQVTKDRTNADRVVRKADAARVDAACSRCCP